MPFTKLVVAGSSGFLADPILPALLNSTSPKFDITILTRANSGKSPAHPGAKIVAVDYDDHKDLVKAVTGADAIVSLLAGVPGKAIDHKLLKAAQEAGVRRIFPSEFTLDILHPSQVALLTEGGDWSPIPSAVEAAKGFTALADQGGPTSFTTLMPSAFLDTWLEGKIDLFDPKNRKITVIDGGDKFWTGCTLPFLASALIAALQMDEEKTKNKRIPVAEVRATTNDVVAAYEEALGGKFEKTIRSSEELIQMRDQCLAGGDAGTAMFLCIEIGAFNGSGAGDLKEGLEFDGDGFLSAKRKTLKEMVGEAAAKVNAS